MRVFLALAPCALIVGCAGGAAAAAPPTQPEPPKTVTITLDSQGLAVLADVIQKSNAPHQEVMVLSAEIDRQIQAQAPKPAK